MNKPLIRKVDCVQFHVPTIEEGLAFYRDQLGQELVWRTDRAAGLRLPDSDAEIVIQCERPDPEVDLLVESADQAAAFIQKSGGEIVVAPFDIQIGRCVVVKDPFGNILTLLDASKGLLNVDEQGNILGNLPPTSVVE